MADKEPCFIVNGTEYPIPTDITLGEMCDAETYFGVEFGNNATSGVRMAAALLFIAIRRVDPRVTVDDIRELPPDVFSALQAQEDARPLASGEEQPGSSDTSGDSSNGAGADPDGDHTATGRPNSETSAIYAPATSTSSPPPNSRNAAA